LGYKWKRVRLSLKDKRDQTKFEFQKVELEQLKKLHKIRYIDLYYCDESQFGLTPNVCYAWQHIQETNNLDAIPKMQLF